MSEWEAGTTFTFVLALGEKTLDQKSILRIRNPIKRIYPKIVIKRKLKKLSLIGSNQTVKSEHNSEEDESLSANLVSEISQSE